jgi:hypothetical protein
MTVSAIDDVIKEPNAYVRGILDIGFQDITIGEQTFKNIQPRDNNDELANAVHFLFPGYKIVYNFVRKSPFNQAEPNFIHTDEMMGDITVILYLNKLSPAGDGTIIYDNDHKPLCRLYSKYNRMVAFLSRSPHSRSIFDNFGDGDDARLIQVIFLKANIHEQ